jgi:hypothetical protein
LSILRKTCLVAAFAGGIGVATSAEAAAGRPVANSSTPLTHAEIYRLYGQKSWLWKDGAGYFSVRERRFTAWSSENGSLSYGVGRWFITGPGKLCFRADWRATNGSAPATTCFSHRKVRGVIYQKREPNGEWYVFRNQPAQKGDEFSKLRRGNYVGAKLDKIEARIGGAE